MFSLKVLALTSFMALALVFRAQAMPDCAVCAGSNLQFPERPAFKAQSAAGKLSLGEKKVLYMRVRYSDDAAEPITQSEAESLMAQVGAWFEEHSHGQFSIRSTVTPLLQLPFPKQSYFPTNEQGQLIGYAYQLLDHARTAARDAGYDPANFDFHLVRFNAPHFQSYGWIGAPGAWLVTSHPATTIHEMGHNMGLQHANSWQGGIHDSGSNREYGDYYDIMGNPSQFELAGFHAANKLSLGWLPESGALQVTNSGIYRIHAHDGPSLNPTSNFVLRIRKDDERDYWIEKRQRMDLFAVPPEPGETGVLVHWDAWWASNRGTHLVDANGGLPGETLPEAGFSDDGRGLKITPVAQAADNSWVDLSVVFGKSTLNIQPGVLHFSGEPGRSYQLQVSNDLRSWRQLEHVMSSTGEITLSIDSSGKQSFYRVVEEPDLM